MKVWRLTSADAALWRDIRLRSLADAPDAFDSTLAEWQDAPLADFAQRLASTRTFVASQDGLGADATAAWARDDDAAHPNRAWLISVFTDSAMRGRGLAGAVVRAVMQDAAKHGMVDIGLHVRTGATAALALYTSLGFRNTGRQGVVNSRNQPELEMLCDLAKFVHPA